MIASMASSLAEARDRKWGSTPPMRDATPNSSGGCFPSSTIEVTLETVAEVRGEKISLSREILRELKNVGKGAQIIVHGVGLSIGSHEGWSPTYFRLLDEFLDQIDIAWHSEHLAYTKVDGEHLGIMLAMPKTEEALDMI